MTKRIPIGDLLSRTFDLYGSNIAGLVQVAAVIWLIPAILDALLVLVTDNVDSLSGAGLLIFGSFATSIISFIAGMLLAGVMTLATRDAVDGREVDEPRTLIDRARPFLGGLFQTALVLFGIALVAVVVLIVLAVIAGPLVVIGGLAAIVAGVFYGVRVSLSSSVVVLEGVPGGMPALRRSMEVTEGVFWPLLGLLVVVGIISAIGSGIVQGILNAILPGHVFETFLGTLVANAVLGPLTAIASVLAYLQLIGYLDGADAAAAAAPVVPVTPAAAPVTPTQVAPPADPTAPPE